MENTAKISTIKQVEQPSTRRTRSAPYHQDIRIYEQGVWRHPAVTEPEPTSHREPNAQEHALRAANFILCEFIKKKCRDHPTVRNLEDQTSMAGKEECSLYSRRPGTERSPLNIFKEKRDNTQRAVNVTEPP